MTEIKFNLNDNVRAKLTDKGWHILYSYYNRFEKRTEEGFRRIYDTDENGYVSFQMWNFMQIFGNHVYMGLREYPFDLNIIILSKE